MKQIKITEELIEWYQRSARALPWRRGVGDANRPDPYHVWISEIMLQQTRVEAVKGYYQRFLQRLPGIAELAAIPEDELMKLWQGLGYYNRARNLQKAAQTIREEYNGKFPSEYEQIVKLPGIGEYTAGAIASIAFEKKVPAVDGNVYRIYTRLTGDSSDITKASVKRKIREAVWLMMPEKNPGDFNQAWMDLGAGICLPNGEPLCMQCPLQSVCRAYQQGNPLAYPVKPAKKQRKQEKRTIIVLEYQGKYLLQKRPPKGLLAGLWEFPSQEGNLSLEQLYQYLLQWGLSAENQTSESYIQKVELLGKAKHIFSHIEWHMLGYCVCLQHMPQVLKEIDGVWVSKEEMKENYSIPSAFSVYYEAIIRKEEL